MARTNTQRSTTVDSLYRDRTPDGLPLSSQPQNSDEENAQPAMESSKTPARPPAPGTSSLPNGFSLRRANKRLRLDRAETPSALVEEILSQHPRQEERGTKRYYDPEQNQELKRDLRMALRNSNRDLRENRDEYIKDKTGALLLKHLRYHDALVDQSRHPAEAALESEGLLEMAGISRMQITNEAFGKGSLGVDIDQFVSRCIGFMRQRGASGSAPAQDDPEDDAGAGETLDWHVLGKYAGFTSNRRPAVPSFLLGPLSVEKRVRNTQRTARQARDPLAAVARPEELRAEDLEKNEGSNLVNLCKGIRERLDEILTEGGKAVEEFGERPDVDELSDEEIKDVFRQNHLALNQEVSLFEFAINPHSFGQTVENLFYISFLVRDGFVQVSFDDDGLPTIRTTRPSNPGEQQDRGEGRHQAILSLDHETWRKLVMAFDIHEPLIPHRAEESATQVTQRGWYG